MIHFIFDSYSDTECCDDYMLTKKLSENLLCNFSTRKLVKVCKQFDWEALPCYNENYIMYINESGLLYGILNYGSQYDTCVYSSLYQRYVVILNINDYKIIADGENILVILYNDDYTDNNLIDAVLYYDFNTETMKSCILQPSRNISYTKDKDVDGIKCKPYIGIANVGIKIKYSLIVNPDIYRDMCYCESISEFFTFIGANYEYLNDNFGNIQNKIKNNHIRINEICRRYDYVIIDTQEITECEWFKTEKEITGYAYSKNTLSVYSANHTKILGAIPATCLISIVKGARNRLYFGHIYERTDDDIEYYYVDL